jgi:predicted acyl esterase
MMLRNGLVYLSAMLALPGLAGAAEPALLGGVTEKHVLTPMRDGTRLSTYLFLPPGKGPWPVLYEQRYADLRAAATRKAFARLAAAGYVVAAQNFRGTHLSEGVWVGYRALGWGKQRDGHDTVEWLAKQPWSTGKVGTFGSSQAGFAQNFLAVARPPHLVCQYMIDTGLSLFHEGYRIGGTTRPQRFKQMEAVCRNPEDNRRLLREWFAHPTYDAYWAEEDCTRHFDRMNVPCFTVGSWYDFMCVGSVESYIGRQHEGGPGSRGKQQLLLGPWLHGRFKETNKVGELTYPENAKFALEAHMIRWFDHYLKGADNGVPRDPALRYYVMGAVGEKGAPGNEWRSAADWPVHAQETAYYLRAGGKLSTLALVGERSATSFKADPLHPNEVPGRAFPGAADARRFEKQAEVRTFTSDVLAAPVEWTGKVRAELYVSSTAKDTDFIVRVSDVYPDGRSILLMDYVHRARYRDSYDREVLMEPGKVYKVAFDVGWTSQVYNKGHRIRVTVASTGAPFYEPNPNTGEPLTIEPPVKTVVATNAVHHERGHASRVLAPVRPLDASASERGQLERGLEDLRARLARLSRKVKPDDLADASIHAKAVAWALRYEETLTASDAGRLKEALRRGNERAAALEAGTRPWAERKGKVVRAFVSAIDGSVQPYGMIVPKGYDPAKPMRLDVVLHGSSRPVGMSELRFLGRFDQGDGPAADAPAQPYLELHPLGRVENCYRWPGETDVFEAIEAACRNYRIDRDRIVLRGMSMGASGTWHLGLKHPDRFVALGPYCGYVDTHHFSRTPLPNFVKVDALPPHQEKALRLLDSVGYAANAGVVPAVACMGEKDVFFQAHVLMGEAMKKEGLLLVNLISPGTGHVQDPATHAEQMRRIAAHAARGIDHAPRHLRFVTWSLKYSRCHWLRILGLSEHYQRAELEADVTDDGSVTFKEPKNVTLFSFRSPVPAREGARLRVGGREVAPLRPGGSREVRVRRRGDGWELAPAGALPEGKRPGLQGPIDDAFTAPFLCVRGTGKPWSPAVQAWSEASLKRFAYEWHRYFRGDLPVKDDTAVTEDDVRRCHLILFGDPGSNRWIAKVTPQLPLRWTREELHVAGTGYRAADHAPVLIHPSPLAEGRYVVLNSGHTFHEKELASLNYLLFPRLGDWAVLEVGAAAPVQPSGPLRERVLRAGFFDERWRFAGTAPRAGEAGKSGG